MKKIILTLTVFILFLSTKTDAQNFIATGYPQSTCGGATNVVISTFSFFNPSFATSTCQPISLNVKDAGVFLTPKIKNLWVKNMTTGDTLSAKFDLSSDDVWIPVAFPNVQPGQTVYIAFICDVLADGTASTHQPQINQWYHYSNGNGPLLATWFNFSSPALSVNTCTVGVNEIEQTSDLSVYLTFNDDNYGIISIRDNSNLKYDVQIFNINGKLEHKSSGKGNTDVVNKSTKGLHIVRVIKSDNTITTKKLIF